MIFFITFLRALAACFITNAHYTGIYPTDLIANGGLVGDVLFFAISGYCLYNIKYSLSLNGFIRWYSKRLWRIYLPVLIVTTVYLIIGSYQFSEDRGFFWWIVFPTNYHFVASIIILYIPFFFLMKIEVLRKRILLVMAGIVVVWLIVYWSVYDRSYYHIDTVREPMIRFLFMESMLLGAWFRQNDMTFRNKFKPIYPILTIVLFGIYFASKVLFSKKTELSTFQFLNQIAIFLLLFFVFRLFCGVDETLEKMPVFLKKTVTTLSKITLEIYVVQYVIIDAIRELNLFFPLNWVLLTGCIFLAAMLLHTICELIYGATEKMLSRRRDK